MQLRAVDVLHLIDEQRRAAPAPARQRLGVNPEAGTWASRLSQRAGASGSCTPSIPQSELRRRPQAGVASSRAVRRRGSARNGASPEGDCGRASAEVAAGSSQLRRLHWYWATWSFAQHHRGASPDAAVRLDQQLGAEIEGRRARGAQDHDPLLLRRRAHLITAQATERTAPELPAETLVERGPLGF